MISFRLDASKFENLYKKLLPTISTFSYVSGQTKQVCPTVQPIRHTRHNCSFTIRAWTAISKTGLKRSNLNFNSIRHWYQSLLHLSNYIILNPLSDCKRFQLKLVPIFMRFYRWFKKKKRGWDKSPSLSIIFGLSSKTQWLSGLYYADFISFYSPTLNYAEVGRRNRILTNDRFLSHSHLSSIIKIDLLSLTRLLKNTLLVLFF